MPACMYECVCMYKPREEQFFRPNAIAWCFHVLDHLGTVVEGMGKGAAGGPAQTSFLSEKRWQDIPLIWAFTASVRAREQRSP